MTGIWVGDKTVRQVLGSGELHLDGPASLTRKFSDWLKLSMFAVQERQNRKQGKAKRAM